MIRSALTHLAIGVVLGGLILAAKGYPAGLGWSWRLLSTHIQLLIGGWLVQLALGMAYWILPRLDGHGERGRPIAAWTSWGALNTGVGGTALALALRSFNHWPWLDGILLQGAVLQIIALGAFVWHAWPRVRPNIVPTIRPQANRAE